MCCAATLLVAHCRYSSSLILCVHCALQLGKSNDAAIAYRQVLNIQPLNAVATLQLARIYQQRSGDCWLLFEFELLFTLS
jgi:cytochrome c-type biogenesis protein CcmH/NrfG